MSKRPYKICKKVARQVIVFYGLTPDHMEVIRTLNTYLKERGLEYSREKFDSMVAMVSELIDDATIDIKFHHGKYHEVKK